MMRILIELTAVNVTNIRGGRTVRSIRTRDYGRGSTLVVSSYTQSNFESCSSAINRFNRKWFRTLSQPFSVETRSLQEIVVTRLPCNLPVRGLITQVTRKWHASDTPVAVFWDRKNNSGRYQCNRFNPIWCGLKKLSNPKRCFFGNRTRSNSTNLTNLKRLIPIEHDLGVLVLFSIH